MPQGSKTKKSGASSTSKSVRFSLGAAATPENNPAAAAAPEPEAGMEAVESGVAEDMQLATEGASRKTRSGRLLSDGVTDTDTCLQQQHVSSPGSVVTQEVVPTTGRIRTTRSGRTFSAQTEASSKSETASLLSKRDHEADSQLAGSVRAAGQGTSSSSPAPEPSRSQAAAPAASADDSLCPPWKTSLLGNGLSLPEDDRLSDRGRPPTTDHPCHKKKSASMTRR